MVAREPSETPTEEFVPDFGAPAPPVASRLRASEAFTRRRDANDVGLSLLDDHLERSGETVVVRSPAVDDLDGDADGGGDAPEPREKADRGRLAVIASLVAVAALAGVLTGYLVVQAAGGWDSVWVTSGDGAGVKDPPEPTPTDAPLGQNPSASASPSGSASATPSGSGTPSSPPEPGQPGGTPTDSDPDPTDPPRTPSPTPTPSESPSDPQPSKSKPHDDD